MTVLQSLPSLLKKFHFIEEDILKYLNQNKHVIIFLPFEAAGLFKGDPYNSPSSTIKIGLNVIYRGFLGTPNVTLDSILKLTSNVLKKSSNVSKIYTMDLHDDFTFQGGIYGLVKYIQIHNINYLLTWVEGDDVFEYQKIKHLLNQLSPHSKIITVPHLINNTICKNYNQEKCYDLLVFGNTEARDYTFRYRVKNLLIKNSHKYKIKIINYGELWGEDLYKEINKSYLCLSTCMKYKYLVKKYFEISGCYSLIIGNMPQQGKKIFGNNYINIEEHYSDDQILEIINKALSNKQEILQKTKKNYDIVQSNYSESGNYVKKFWKKVEDEINKTKLLPSSPILSTNTVPTFPPTGT
jgi:hypothetical protein